MTDKQQMPAVVYLHPTAAKSKTFVERIFETDEVFINQSAINAPDLLMIRGDNELLERVSSARILHGARAYYLPEDILALEEAALKQPAQAQPTIYDKAYANVLAVRGSNDVPAFDLCVQEEMKQLKAQGVDEFDMEEALNKAEWAKD